ncbi:hypothetical protein KIW84_043487 [Lathyrus oleraceus]|uniref:Amino acid transporter transmembrane domain-containing protein n=1 Tax=Pisum sativum TaxID=3888 RepID=A0A9D4XIH4_PEA|nr:hypothetical protein KIW84_043487 [Pisum sativum]
MFLKSCVEWALRRKKENTELIWSKIASPIFKCSNKGYVGYAAFGDNTLGKLLTGFRSSRFQWLVNFTNSYIVIHLVGPYQVLWIPKRGHVSKGSSSRAAPTPSAPTFPNLKFLPVAHAEKFLKLLDYHVVKERAFHLYDLRGFEEIGEHLQQMQWVNFNNLIHETNKSIGLEFYANAAFGPSDSYTSYVR